MKTLFIKYCQHASATINYGVLVSILMVSLWMNTNWIMKDWILLASLGFITWTFLEYILHRYIFHWIAEQKFIKTMVYCIHGIHHEYFATTNYVPFLQNILFYGGGALFFYGIFGDQTFIFYTGFLVAVIFQVYIHNLVHVGGSKYFKKLQWHHQYHHMYSDFNFGISTRFWDWVFGSLKREADVRKSRWLI